MKSHFLYTTLLCSMILFSCDDNSPITDTGYIRAKINGIETIYSTSVDDDLMHYMSSDELHISFQKGGNKYLTWTIVITGIDFRNIAFPLVIKGPKDAGLNEPAFWCNILDADPQHSAYGKNLAGTTSLYWNTALTLTSIDGKVVKGTFEGEGETAGNPGIFTDGEFIATFK